MMSRHAASWLPLAVSLCFAGVCADAGTWYVDKDNVSSVRNGMTWATAFPTVQAAIDAAYGAGGGEVWVAEGRYGEERTSLMHFPRVNTGSIVLRPGVSLYGGFAGTETLRDQRDWFEHLTLLDGSRALMGLPAIHVVAGADNAALDGFVVTGGHSVTPPAGYSPNLALGAGLYNDGVSIQVANCIFTMNTSEGGGGGMYANGGSGAVSSCLFAENAAVSGAGLFVHGGALTVSDCQFEDNAATSVGGGICNDGAHLVVNSSSFVRNSAASGGGLQSTAGDATVSDCAFRSNTVAANGGALNLQQATLSTIEHCTFLGNRASAGGGIHMQASQAHVVACGFFGNEADAGGGGGLKMLSCKPADVADPINTVVNCVFWRNSASSLGGAFDCDLSRADVVNGTFEGNRLTDEAAAAGATLYVNTTLGVDAISAQNCIFTGSADQEFSLTNGGLTLSYCLIAGGYEGIGNLDAAPQFAAVDAGDLRLAAGSPGLNAGAANSAAADDMLGVPRPQDGVADMGAFERLVNALDSDGDGVPNAYESGDTDGDGAPDVLDTDSDGDGLGDAEEGMADVDGDGRSNCADADSDDDGVEDALERALVMDAYLPDDPEGDPDEDGLTTGEEVELGTRPYEADTDGDEMPDDWEVEHELNPLSAADGLADPDFDGVRNVDEYRVGSDPRNGADPARDVYVSPLGDDVTGIGTPEKPWRTIAWANSIGNAGRYYSVRDVSIHLAEGVYEEPVNLLPNTALVGDSPQTATLQFFSASAAEHVVVRGAEGASLRNLRVKAAGNTTVPSVLVQIDGVATEVANVVLDGNFNPYTEGLRISGVDSSGSVVRDTVFRRLDRGVVAVNSGAAFTANTFEDILSDAVFVRPPDAKVAEPVAVPRLGEADAVETTGLNRFRNVYRYAVLNVSGEPVMAENNDWGVYTPVEIQQMVGGAVDAVPYLGTAVSPGALVIRLHDAVTGAPIDPSANPQVALATPSMAGVLDEASGLWLLSGVPMGNRVVSAAADGYAVGVRVVTLTTEGVTGLDMALLTSGIDDPANVDHLGGVNAMDVQLVINSALGAVIPFINADIDGDGRVNARDVQTIINAVLRGK